MTIFLLTRVVVVVVIVVFQVLIQVTQQQLAIYSTGISCRTTLYFCWNFCLRSNDIFSTLAPGIWALPGVFLDFEFRKIGVADTLCTSAR